MTEKEILDAFKYIAMKCDMIINNDKYVADDWTQDNVEDIAELCNHILDGDYGKQNCPTLIERLDEIKANSVSDEDYKRVWGEDIDASVDKIMKELEI